MASEADCERIRNLLDEIEEDILDEDLDESDQEEKDNLQVFLDETDTEQEGEDSENDMETDEKPTLQTRPQQRVATYVGRDGHTLWKMHCPPIQARTRQSNADSNSPRIRGDARKAKSPIDCWSLFFNSEFLNIILDNTNLYIDKCRPNFNRERSAKLTDMIEIKAFFGLLYLAGCLKSGFLNLNELWDRNGCGVERFWLAMSRERFLFLLRHLRFDIIDTREERRSLDKFAPIREVFQIFTENCINNYTVGEFTTIDEMLLGFRGRCPFRQYMPRKPTKYGLKVFALVDTKTRYMYNWEPYVGEQPEGPFRQETNALNVVLRLITPISGTGRNITMDNYFTSFPLINILIDEHKLTVVGTVSKNNRELPLELVNTITRPVNSSIFGYQENVTICSYVPKKGKNVIIASSRRQDIGSDESTDEQLKPEMITFYNSTKGGVDALNKLCSLYDVGRNTRRWPMAILFGLLNVAGVNSQVVFTTNNFNTKLTRRDFLKELSVSLTAEHIQRRSLMINLPLEVRTRRQEVAGTVPQHSRAHHYPEGTRKRCHLCRKNSKSKYYCQYCFKFICLTHAAFSCPSCPFLGDH